MPAVKSWFRPVRVRRSCTRSILTKILQLVHVLFQLFPSVLMLCVIQGAFFAAAVVMAQDILRIQIIDVRQPCQQGNQGIIGLLGK